MEKKRRNKNLILCENQKKNQSIFSFSHAHTHTHTSILSFCLLYRIENMSILIITILDNNNDGKKIDSIFFYKPKGFSSTTIHTLVVVVVLNCQ